MNRARAPAVVAIASALLSVAAASAGAADDQADADRIASPSIGLFPVWAYAAFGESIGRTGIEAVTNGSDVDLYLGAATNSYGIHDYWYALRWRSGGGGLQHLFVSPFYDAGINRIVLADVAGDPAPEVILGLDNGNVEIHARPSHVRIASFATAARHVLGLAVADVDGDSENEILVSNDTDLFVYSPGGVLEWQLPGAGGTDIAVAQMDLDPQLEIALTGGKVVDALSRTEQWQWPDGFGRRLQAADIDGDGRAELIAAEPGYFVWSYDVEQQLPKWSIPFDLGIGPIRVTDIDGDGTQELLVGDIQQGEIVAFDTVTQAREWGIRSSDNGITAIAVADVDGDGRTEVIWGASGSFGRERLYVADWQRQSLDWQSKQLEGPFVGPEIADLDGDGAPEMVVVSSYSGGGYSSGRIVVFDATTLALRATSLPIVGGSAVRGVHDLKLRDIDGDGDSEIVLATDQLYDGLVAIYDFTTGDDFDLVWTNATKPVGSPFHSVEVVDVDGDGALEVVAGGGHAHSGSLGVFVYVYDFASGAEEWHSLHLGGNSDEIPSLAVADFDRDGVLEIAVATIKGHAYVFDGATKKLEATIPGEFTDLHSLRLGQASLLLTGDATGAYSLHLGLPDAYPRIYTANAALGPIDGLTVDGGIWLGSEGRLSLVKGTQVLAQTARYGKVFGERKRMHPSLPLVLSAGTYSVVGFLPYPMPQ